MTGRAFTLLELLAVVAILGLIGSAVGVSLQDAALRSRSVTARQQLIAFDADCRRLARAQGGGVMEFDLFERVATFLPNHTGSEAIQPRHRFAAAIRAVSLVGQNVPMTAVPVSALGVSPSYVVELEPTEGLRPLRLLFAGGTGLAVTLEEGVYADSYPH